MCPGPGLMYPGRPGPVDRSCRRWYAPYMAGQPFSTTGPHAQDAEVRIDVSFPVTGPPVPLDHGYALYAALCERRGELHGAEWLAVHPLPGTPRPDGTLDLGHDAALRLRVPPGELTRLLG